MMKQTLKKYEYTKHHLMMDIDTLLYVMHNLTEAEQGDIDICTHILRELSNHNIDETVAERIFTECYVKYVPNDDFWSEAYQIADRISEGDGYGYLYLDD